MLTCIGGLHKSENVLKWIINQKNLHLGGKWIKWQIFLICPSDLQKTLSTIYISSSVILIFHKNVCVGVCVYSQPCGSASETDCCRVTVASFQPLLAQATSFHPAQCQRGGAELNTNGTASVTRFKPPNKILLSKPNAFGLSNRLRQPHNLTLTFQTPSGLGYMYSDAHFSLSFTVITEYINQITE